MKAEVYLNKRMSVGLIDKRIYGAFIEHLGRAVYGGIYEPGHPEADEDGFRKDVLALVRELDVPVIRYPGGNFVSSYKWEDTVGPVESRPKRLDLAWKSTEPNEIGLQEFTLWTEKVGSELMMAVNLGTRGVQEANDIVEYANHPGGSYWSELRKEHGREKPLGISLWCLGNEMDGPWQVGQKTAYEYGRLANTTAKALKLYDSSLELVVCGSSGSGMPTFPEWERQVLEECYDNVDYISLHSYLQNAEDDLDTFLASPISMDDYIQTVINACDYVKAKKRSKKTIYLSFDEWNVWFHSNQQDENIYKNTPWQVGPALLEDIYTFEDALVVGMMLNSLIRHSDRVKLACMAQLVNVIAPIMTENGGPAWRQTIFYPYQYASRYGRGTALKLDLSSPSYQNEKYGEVPYLDVSAVYNENNGELALFLINRSSVEAIDISVILDGFEEFSLSFHKIMTHEDHKAVNTKENPDNVAPSDGSGLSIKQGRLQGKVQPLSWNCVVLEKA
ncbi:arabinosylfuranosidase ArfA [Spirochaeta dissipatitropha]